MGRDRSHIAGSARASSPTPGRVRATSLNRRTPISQAGRNVSPYPPSLTTTSGGQLKQPYKLELASEPCSGELPIAFQGGYRDVQSLGGVGFAQTAEKTQFNHFGRPLVERLQTGQPLVNRQQSFIELPGAVRFQELQPDLAAAALSAPNATSVIHQHPPQLLGCNGEKMSPIFPVDRTGAAEPQIRLMHESRGLELPLAASPGALPIELGADNN